MEALKIRACEVLTSELGSAFYIDTKHIVTCAHVVGKHQVGDKIEIRTGDILHHAVVLEISDDPGLDFAILNSDFENISIRPIKVATRITDRILVCGYVSRALAVLHTRWGGQEWGPTSNRIRLSNEYITKGLSGSGLFTDEPYRLIGLMQAREKSDPAFGVATSIHDIIKNSQVLSKLSIPLESEIHSFGSFAKIFCHYLDHHVILTAMAACQNAHAVKKNVFEAFVTSVLLFDELKIPAVSYVQSTWCRRLVATVRENLPDYAVTLVGDGYDVCEFLEKRLSEYRPQSEEHTLYGKALRNIKKIPNFQSLHSDTTAWLKDVIVNPAWMSFAERQLILPESSVAIVQENYAQLGEKLNGLPILSETIAPLLGQPDDLRYAMKVKAAINSMFMRSMHDGSRTFIFQSIPYFNNLIVPDSYYRLDYPGIRAALSKDSEIAIAVQQNKLDLVSRLKQHSLVEEVRGHIINGKV